MAMQALTGELTGFNQRREQEQQKQQQAQAQQQRQQELSEAFKSGNPDKIAEVSFKYPEMSKLMDSQLQFKSESTKRNALDSLRRVNSGEDPERVFQERMEKVTSEGGDPSHTIAELESYRKDPEGWLKQSERALALMDPEGYKSLKSTTPQPEERKPFQMGSGEMAGHVFDPNTGQFSINPNIKQKLEETRSQATLDKGKVDAKTRQGINKDITQLTSDTKLIRNTASDLEKLKKSPSGPASIAMVFKFMKALDPTSVVREGEFATAENSAGVPETIRNIFNKLKEGERLGEAQMSQFVETAQQLANNAIASSNTEITSYLDTYEDTLPKGFKDSLQRRIPKPFGVKKVETLSKQQTENTGKANSTQETETQVIEWGDLP